MFSGFAHGTTHQTVLISKAKWVTLVKHYIKTEKTKSSETGKGWFTEAAMKRSPVNWSALGA